MQRSNQLSYKRSARQVSIRQTCVPAGRGGQVKRSNQLSYGISITLKAIFRFALHHSSSRLSIFLLRLVRSFIGGHCHL